MPKKTNRFPGLYLKRGWWYYWPPTGDDGVRPKAVALRTRDYVEAVTEATELRDEIREVRAYSAGRMSEALGAYFREKGHHTRKTREQREGVLNGMCEILGDPRVDRVDAEMVAMWIRHLETKGSTLEGKRGVRPASKKSYVIVAKAFFGWAVESGRMRRNPLNEFRDLTRIYVTKVNEFLSEAERERVMAAFASEVERERGRAGASGRKPKAQGSKLRPSRLESLEFVGLVLHLGFFAGLREAEMLAMKPEWIWVSDDGAKGTISVQSVEFRRTDGAHGSWTPKGKRKRVVPLHPRLLEYLKGYKMRGEWALAPDKVRWPVNSAKRYDAKKALRGLAVKAGVKKMNFHIMRHTFATLLSMKGVKIAEIAELLGDRIKVTEDSYAGFQPSGPNPLDVL